MIVALYARVSTGKQAEKELSVPDQLNQMREWCAAQGHSVATEFEELGASATDDRRPVFQEMIQDACAKPSPFDAIVVYSLSRFFRDAIMFGLYERQLEKHGVQVVSITQQTNDDPGGMMARRIFSLFDEYQSAENSKHTLRAMKENARQGFFNGSRPPYGYRIVPVDAPGRKGCKKKLEVNPDEANIVQRIFELYTKGDCGIPIGVAQIAATFNKQGLQRRGKRWGKETIAALLSCETYIGKYYFNKSSAKARESKPLEEWILVKVDPIIDEETFSQAERLRETRSPQKTPARVTSTPTLLTGLLKCSCGASMTLATGKGGRYRYYKCTSKIKAGKHTCSSKSLPMDQFDSLILNTMAEQIFTPSRVSLMLKEFRSRLKGERNKHTEAIRLLKKELGEAQVATDRLYEAVESGLPFDDNLKERLNKHQAKRQDIESRIADLNRKRQVPLTPPKASVIEAFCRTLKDKFKDGGSQFSQAYLRLLLKEIRVEGQEVQIKGDYAILAGALKKTKVGVREGVPTFVNAWLPELGSNQRQSD